MTKITSPQGDISREAVDSLGGYAYQIYQSAIAWIALEADEFLFLEVAEDYATVTENALNAVQIKQTSSNVTINSEDIVASIDSFVELQEKNHQIKVRLRHLTTSLIGKEKSSNDRVGDTPTLELWRKLAKHGDIEPLRKILLSSKLSQKTKNYIKDLDENNFRDNFLRRIYFDCGAPDSSYVLRLLRNKLFSLIHERGGVNSQVDGCLNNILVEILKKSILPTDRYLDRNEIELIVEKATHVSINISRLDDQNKLINKALASSIGEPSNNLLSSKVVEPKNISDVPLPNAIASRKNNIGHIASSLESNGVSWIYGSSGVGKTIGARIAARNIGGNWLSINARGLNSEQTSLVVTNTADYISSKNIHGLLVDDIVFVFNHHINDALLYLKTVCDHSNLLLIFTSPKNATPDFLFGSNLTTSIEVKFEEFSEEDISEILIGLGADEKLWSKYIHLISGGGHPQLTIAVIQNLINSSWNTDELRTLSSIIEGNPAVEQVRSKTRERLLQETEISARRLLERLSLNIGNFNRNLVLDIGSIDPKIEDAGILFDRLIGSWIDQISQDQFSLSPLISDLAEKTLNENEKKVIHNRIADSILSRNTLTPNEANSALLSAWMGKNSEAITHLCIGLLKETSETLDIIAPHMPIFTSMRTDRVFYEDDPFINLLFRGVQLILSCHSEINRESIKERVACFKNEIKLVENIAARSTMTFLILTKTLFAASKSGSIPNFWDLILDLENLPSSFPPELLEQTNFKEFEGVSMAGALFFNQVRQVQEIGELLSIFEFLNICESEFRDRLLRISDQPNVDSDMVLSGAWLSEHKSETLNNEEHITTFYQIEELSNSWGKKDLAVCARKYRAIIIDEYLNDKERALSVLDEGLEIYGKDNYELVRAKAKVLYRSDDHLGSLELSKRLIRNNAPLSTTEKAFLGRDAAISAEKQGEYELAREFYHYGSEASKECSIPEMDAMYVGLLADAALASWNSGDRETCLLEFITVLQELEKIDPKSSTRAAHCHATSRHALLWLDQEATGEKRQIADGEDCVIYPGIISNPEPHPEIGERYLIPIDMAWYMLAKVENNSCLDLGITKNLASHLKNGPVHEGVFMLSDAKMRKSLILLEHDLFCSALVDSLSEYELFSKNNSDAVFDLENITYGEVTKPSCEFQEANSNFIEQRILIFLSKCIFERNIVGMNKLIAQLEQNKELYIRDAFLKCLKGEASASEFNSSLACTLSVHGASIEKSTPSNPRHIFELGFKVFQLSSHINKTHLIEASIQDWLVEKCRFILGNQRFLLRNPRLHENAILDAISVKNSSPKAIAQILKSLLPVLGISNEVELHEILNGYLGTK